MGKIPIQVVVLYIHLTLLPCLFGNVLAFSGKMIDIANFAVKQSPSSTRFITNKMCPFGCDLFISAHGRKAQKVWIALEAANAPYEMQEISLYGPNGKPDWFMQLNPAGTVPVLTCHGGAVRLRDSDDILDAFGTAVENGSSLVANDTATLEKIKQFRATLKELLPVGKEAVLGGNRQKMWKKLVEMDSMIQGPYICGDKVTIADCAAFPFLWRIDSEFGPLEAQGCQKLRNWLNYCQANEAFSKTIQSSWWWWW